MGHVDFVKEIIRLKPVLTREVNQEGFSPMHIAADNGHVEIVKDLIKVDVKLGRLEGRQKMTPFHHAAIRGRAEVISLMLSGCPDCIEDETERRESALHLAVRNNRFEAIKKLVDWIREMNKEYLLNMKDEQGNTVLHLASWKKQCRVINSSPVFFLFDSRCLLAHMVDKVFYSN
jgi:ankyrin repeat protein